MPQPLVPVTSGAGPWLFRSAGLGVLFLARVAIGATPVDFERDVAPVLAARCLECHVEAEAAGGLVLTKWESVFKGGDSGAVVVPGRPDGSLLIERVTAGEMPPEKKGKSQRLPEREVAALRAWVAEGAVWPEGRVLDPYERTTEAKAGRDWWSLQPVRRPAVPGGSPEAENPIDAFVFDRLRSEGMEPAPEADRRTLIRRLSFDLIGLPPSAEAIDSFEADATPDAYERLVDRLLADPRYGERWGRYWLDLARYADTCGYERDQEKPGAWRYRDWVVRALNEDMLFGRFIREQLAGDELPDRSEETLVATGFLRLGTWNDEPNDPEEYKYERLEDLVQTTSVAFLGLTVKCARCHDHKFDPVPQVDYYRLAGAFWPGPIEPRDRELLGGPTRDELRADVLGWTDVRREPPPLFLMKKGDPARPLFPVEPGDLSFVASIDTEVMPTPADSRTTRRRSRLADWIADPRNPLPPRVFVNRLWQHHFGEGLVRSPDNFGFLGEKPTHPELLDCLASEFVRNGGRSKPLHRLILTSRAYRQSSLHPRQAEYATRDPDNRLLWRADRRRLDAEALRDALLAASGELDLRMGGPGFRPDVSPEALEGLSRKSAAWQPSPKSEQVRRSVYLYSQRSLLPPLMTTFDFGDAAEPCGRRPVSTVAPQALALLNGDFVQARSEALATRIAGDVTTAEERVSLAWRLALGRSPTAEERRAGLAHLNAQEAAFRSRPASERAEQPRGESPLFAAETARFRASEGVTLDEAGRVVALESTRGGRLLATQRDADLRPALVADGIGGRPALRFDGSSSFLKIEGPLLTSPEFTIVAVASGRAADGHREIVSNWDGAAGNSVRSVFLGTTDGGAVRFSDDFSAAGANPGPGRPFLLVAINDERDAAVYLDDRPIGHKGTPLADRRLDTAWVIGTQGNFGHEFWDGDIAEIVVFDRALTDEERRSIWLYARGRYGLGEPAPPSPSPGVLALASLCQVLLNTNESLYVD